MPVEVEAQQHLFTQPPLFVPPKIPQRSDLSKRPGQELVVSGPSGPRIKPLSRYHVVHDLESIWWMAVYIILCHPIDFETRPRVALDTQRDVAARLFHNLNERTKVITDARFFDALMTTCQFTEPINSISRILTDVLALLVNAYRVAGTDPGYDFSDSIIPELHKGLISYFEFIVEHINEFETERTEAEAKKSAGKADLNPENPPSKFVLKFTTTWEELFPSKKRDHAEISH